MKYDKMEIGEIFWWSGDEYKCTRLPYKLYGGWFQDGERISDLKGVAVAIKLKD